MKKRAHHWILIALGTWQAMAFTCGFIGWIITSHNVPPTLTVLGPADQDYLDALLNPSKPDVEKARAFAEDAATYHAYAMCANCVHCSPTPTLEAVASCEYPSGLSWSGNHPYRMLYKLTAPKEAKPLELVGVHNGCFELISSIDQLDKLLPHRHRLSHAQQLSKLQTQILWLIGQRQYKQVANLISDNITLLKFKNVIQLLTILDKDQRSFNPYLELLDFLDKLLFLSRADELKIARIELYWRAYAMASDDRQRAEAFARIEPFCPKSTEIDATSIRLCAATGELCQHNANALESIAQDMNKDDRKRLAAKLFGLVADQMPRSGPWGRCVFNKSCLLRELRHPRQAIATLRRIFPSSVNDADSAPYIMNTVRDYRHRSAKQIAQCYDAMWNFPAAWYWRWQAAKRYTSMSWCGTCRRSIQKQADKKLTTASLKAGPIFVLASLFSAPLATWRIGLVLFGVWMTWRIARRLRHWMARRPQASQP